MRRSHSTGAVPAREAGVRDAGRCPRGRPVSATGHTYEVNIGASVGRRPEVEYYLERWRLKRDGESFATPSSMLAPVRYHGKPAMLKIATATEEAFGNRLMVWWNGHGAARVFEHDDTAVLLERALGVRSLAAMAEGGEDDAATRILCSTVGRLHSADGTPPNGLRTLTDWFAELFLHAHDVGGFFARSAVIASELLADQREIVVLHGDMHHGNVLDFAGAGAGTDADWLAIDPKHIIGDRAFDFTNILCNPNGEVATRSGRLARQVDVIADAAALDRERLLRWTVAWGGLSAAWLERGNQPPGHALEVGEAAERLLEGAR